MAYRGELTSDAYDIEIFAIAEDGRVGGAVEFLDEAGHLLGELLSSIG